MQQIYEAKRELEVVIDLDDSTVCVSYGEIGFTNHNYVGIDKIFDSGMLEGINKSKIEFIIDKVCNGLELPKGVSMVSVYNDRIELDKDDGEAVIISKGKVNYREFFKELDTYSDDIELKGKMIYIEAVKTITKKAVFAFDASEFSLAGAHYRLNDIKDDIEFTSNGRESFSAYRVYTNEAQESIPEEKLALVKHISKG